MRAYLSALLLAPLLLHGYARVAHRGASGHAPENTLGSFALAIAMGADAIELDVIRCGSGELVVIHDDTVDRTTNGHGRVDQMTLQELQGLDAGNGEHIPTLREVFDFIVSLHGPVAIDIELKGPETAAPVAELVEEYIQTGLLYAGDLMVSSFDHYQLLEFSERLPDIKRGAICYGMPIGLSKFADMAWAQYAVMSYEHITPRFIADAHTHGIDVWVYTVNDEQTIAAMEKLGVDGIISNYPDLFGDPPPLMPDFSWCESCEVEA